MTNDKRDKLAEEWNSYWYGDSPNKGVGTSAYRGFQAGYDSRDAEVAELRAALEFYAKPEVWGNGCAAIDPCDTYTCALGVLRGGKRARAALKKHGGREDG